MHFPSWDISLKYLNAPNLPLHNPTELRLDKMSKHLQKAYSAAYRRRKKEERQLAAGPAVAPVSNAERMRRYRLRKRIAEEGEERGDEFPEGASAGPSVPKRRRQEREGNVPGGSNAAGSTSAERMRRFRERRKRQTGQPTFGRSEQGGASAADSPVAGRVRRRGGRGTVDDSVPNLVAENSEQGKCCYRRYMLKFQGVGWFFITIPLQISSKTIKTGQCGFVTSQYEVTRDGRIFIKRVSFHTLCEKNSQES